MKRKHKYIMRKPWHDLFLWMFPLKNIEYKEGMHWSPFSAWENLADPKTDIKPKRFNIKCKKINKTYFVYDVMKVPL